MGKKFGAIYLILGTCIAAGMLGLPVVTAEFHFGLTALMILSAWLVMTIGAWCLLQVNCMMKPGTNLISMSEATLGHTVKWITWVIYLMLLYSLICAYAAAAGDLIHSFARSAGAQIPRWSATLTAIIILGSIVTHGIRSVDLTNRLLMSAKLIICLILIAAVMPYSHIHQLTYGDFQWHGSAWLVIVCAFGYAIILPSIRDYIGNDKKQLSYIVLLGSLIPMILYFIWVGTIQGALPRFGPDSLSAMNNSPNTNSMLMDHLARLTQYGVLKTLSVVFISICSVTGLLGVSLCLMDFLSDGLKRKKQGKNKALLALLTFMPPTLIVIFDPAIFTSALAYAGALCLYVLVGLPIAMYLSMKLGKTPT